MSLDHPHTPQSPSTFSIANLPPKPSSPLTTTSLPTPAHSINGSMSSLNSDANDQLACEDMSHKRKRELEDNGDQGAKKIQVEDSRIGIDDLHVDVGPKYLLCKTPHPYVRPKPSEDLFAMYGLTAIAGTVVRLWPDGTKNILRKSYKGKIKDSGISGSFDAVKKEQDSSDTLFAMMMQPQEEWDAQYVRGKEIEKGLPDAVRGSLAKAMTMAKGFIPKEHWDPKVLGELGKDKVVLDKTARISGVKFPVAQPSSAMHKTTKGEIPRPKRNIKKRTYGDASFEGYGEGYVDDQEDGGYSTGDGAMGQKRRKKNLMGHHPESSSSGTYGPGMIGA